MKENEKHRKAWWKGGGLAGAVGLLQVLRWVLEGVGAMDNLSDILGFLGARGCPMEAMSSCPSG